VKYPAVLLRLSRVTPEVLRGALQAAWKFVSAGNTRKRRNTPAR